MKLLTKTTLFFITLALFIFFIGGYGFYALFSRLIDNGVNEELTSQMHTILMDIQSGKRKVNDLRLIPGSHINIEKLEQNSNFHYQFKDTVLFNPFKKLYYPHRQLSFIAQKGAVKYKIKIHKSLIATNTLIEHVALATMSLFFLFIICIWILNKFIFKSIWGDFFLTIQKLQKYDIDSGETMAFDDSAIIEFNQLNTVAEKMMRRIHTDYKALKEFTGNISHELQTPISIIKAKIELLMQTRIEDSSQLKHIQEVHSGILRLSRLNKTLILLTKIEHHQYHYKEKLNLAKNINAHIIQMEGLLSAKGISVENRLSNTFEVDVNPDLADILIINLLKNAIRHNIEKGCIKIYAVGEMLCIANSGPALEIDESELFKRFSKDPKKKQSVGLGLAIVKKICDYYGFGIQYKRENEMHVFCVGMK